MQKRIWVWGLVAALVVAAGLWFWNTDEMKDRRVWNRFRDQLTDTNVTKVALEGAAGKRFTMTDSDRRELLELLRSAKFDRSNRVGQGPTVQAFLRLTFADGREATIRIWGVDTYELSPQWLDPGTQFLIKNADLGAWLKLRFQGPAVGAGEPSNKEAGRTDRVLPASFIVWHWPALLR